MKNLIVTLGMILLMSLGLLHDGDSMHMMRMHQEQRRICSAMADAAAAVLENGGTLEEAERSAGYILSGNSDDVSEWELEVVGNTIIVKVRNGDISLQGPAPEEPLNLTCQVSRTFSS